MGLVKKTLKLKFKTEAEYLFIRQLLMKYNTNLQDFSLKAISEAVQQLVNKYEADRAEREKAKQAKQSEGKEVENRLPDQSGGERAGTIATQPESVTGEVQPGGDTLGAVLANPENVPVESSPGPQ